MLASREVFKERTRLPGQIIQAGILLPVRLERRGTIPRTAQILQKRLVDFEEARMLEMSELIALAGAHQTLVGT